MHSKLGILEYLAVPAIPENCT